LTSRPFRVDANEAWDEDEARDKIPWLASQGCQAVEQPLPAGSLDAMAQLKENSPLPLLADEDAPDAAAVADLVSSFHGVNVKLMKTGGVRDAVHMIHEAVGISAAAHLSPLADWADLDGAALLAQDPFVGAEVAHGTVSIPSEPGLGVRRRAGSP
jgi:L-alanine-DL-glutamate epimerase-like enolase superfamily enzyme